MVTKKRPPFAVKSEVEGLIVLSFGEAAFAQNRKYEVYATECRHVCTLTHYSLATRKARNVFGLCSSCARMEVNRRNGVLKKEAPELLEKPPEPWVAEHREAMEMWEPPSTAFEGRYRYAR